MQAQAKNVLMLAAVIASSAIAAGQSAPPSADAYTFAGAQNKNFGTEPNLNLALGETSYIKFDLSGAPEGASVKQATLRLFANHVAFSGSLDLYEAGADWSELTLTALNAPSLGALASSDGQIEIQRANQGLFVQIDLTPRVEKWVKGQLT